MSRPPKSPALLAHRDLAAIVAALQRLLYFDDEADPPQWSGDKPWSGAELADRLAESLAAYGLVPDDEFA